MHSPQRRSSLLAAAQGGCQRGVAVFNGVGSNLVKAAGDLSPEDAIRFNAMLDRAAKLARDAHELGLDIATLDPQAAGRDAA